MSGNKIYVFDENGRLAGRRCARCGLFRPVTEFHKQKNRKFGIHPYCKECRHKLEHRQRAEYQKRRIRELRLKAYQIVSGSETPRCAMSEIWHCCGDPQNGLWLSLDHINDDGAAHRREIGATSSLSFYRWVIKHPSLARKKLQVLCMNAQTMKKRICEDGGTDGEKSTH